MKKKLGLMLNGLTTLFVGLILTFALLNFLSEPGKQGLFGYKGYIVLSDSMQPVFSAGDYIIDRQVPYAQLKVGDVVSYLDSEQAVIVTHRIVAITDEGLAVQGDGNDFIDQTFVTKENFIGKQEYKISKLGHLMLNLSQPIVLIGISFVFGILLLYGFFKRSQSVSNA
ncbi:signal peptidase I [Enterococcus sp. LJL98]